MKQYFKYVKPYLASFIIGPLLMIVEVVGEIFLPKMMSLIINNGVKENDVGYVVGMGGAMLLVAAIMICGGIGGCYLAAKASINFATDLRKDVFGKIQQFSFKNIDHFSTGSLVTRLTNDITQMQNVIRMALIMLLRAPGMLIGALFMAVNMNAKLAIVIAVVIPFLATAIGIIIKIAFPRFDLMQKKLDNLNSGIEENLTNIRVVKSFIREDYEHKKFAKANFELKESTLNAFNVVILNMPVMMLAMNITTIAVVWFGGNFVIGGSMPVGDLSAFTTYIVQILMSLMMLSMILLQSSRAVASARRVGEVLNTEVDLTDEESSKKDAQILTGRVEFKDVSFRYNPENQENILENISFSIEPGETVGIIGATGSGKTSLVQLIPRLYDAYSGEVLVDGVNVRDYSLKHLREAVGMVLQKNVLFSGTIYENLQWGDENADAEEISKWARSAQADGFVTSFPAGYETELGQGGVNISGGQKQRLCIARALLKKPKILILDDSTSAVDTATEASIQESFQNELKATTKIIIAQRITSVMNADKIIVLDDGKIVGMGSHDKLLAENEEYQEIYYSQKDKEASQNE